MVDTIARRQLAALLRHLAAGLLTVDDWDERSEGLAFESQDPALAAIRWQMWFLYCDFWTERLRGRWALTSEGRREVARWLLFLYSDEEYRWPDPWSMSPAGCLLNLITLGGWRRWTLPAHLRLLETTAEPDCWPFFTRADFDAARAHPPLLRGITS